MKNALIFTAKYSQDLNDAWLADELIEQLELNNYKITVFAFGDVKIVIDGKINQFRTEYLFPKGKYNGYKKYLVLWPKMVKLLIADLKEKKEYDLLIAISPLSIILPVITIATKAKIKRKICILFDFFPIHMYQLGMFNNSVKRFFHLTEKFLLKRFDIITGMTPRNVEQIKEYYDINPNTVLIKQLFLWGVKKSNIESINKKDPDKEIKMVFGGQIVPGRSVDKLIEMVVKLRNSGLSLTLTIFSTGEGFENLKHLYADISSIVKFKERMPRNQYIEELKKYDVGAIVTDPRVTMPTFPSKIIDYMNCGLPCFCIIENRSDIEEVMANKRFLHVNNFDFSDKAMENAAAFLKDVKAFNLLEGPAFYENYMVEHAVKVLTA